MAADYQLTAPAEPCAVIRHSDGACIPPDPANRDYAEFSAWKADGGVPDPVPPTVVPTLDSVSTGKTTAEILGAT